MNFNKIRLNYELELIEQILKECEFEKDDDEYKAGKFLLVSLVVGTNGDKIYKLVGITLKESRLYARRARNNRIWNGRKFNVEWFEDYGNISFILDTLVILGDIRRVYE